MGKGWFSRKPAAAIVLSLLLSACAAATEPGEVIGGVNYGKDGDPSLKPRDGGPKDGKDPSKAAAPKNTGSFTVVISAPNGDKLEGVTVRYFGPENGTLVSNRKGEIKATVKVGNYEMRVEKCSELVHVLADEAGAKFSVVGGKRTEGAISAVEWEPRYRPIAEVRSNKKAPWRSGTSFVFKTRIGDRCKGGTPISKSVSMEGWVYETAAPIELQGTPSMVSDSRGWLSATFACRGAGDGDIAIKDPENGARYVSLLFALPKDPPTASYCKL